MRPAIHPVAVAVTTIAATATICLAGYWEFEHSNFRLRLEAMPWRVGGFNSGIDRMREPGV
jgi:hypothetical protein